MHWFLISVFQININKNLKVHPGFILFTLFFGLYNRVSSLPVVLLTNYVQLAYIFGVTINTQVGIPSYYGLR
jgi:hypothetical protein